ncbi:hydroxyproline-rich glycoprotein family protein [Actinidia rufa]|uniref:Hydroxyproline-rich glycoprotein family protein n=1 Tax=Actinidia rufa TaxID=165716 RepID=A0A7J0EDU4_9ERIC|nr:hydroxyproline-rich glycoprotein family protein [Actinidia rufa]
MVASFMLKKPISLLEDNILRLEGDIFDEIEAPTIKVEIVSLKPLTGSNITKVVFAVVSDERNSKVSSTTQSLIRASFVSLVQQYPLRLTASLFGDPFSFEVLKFPGGITISPPQSAFLLQKVQILFNFTLNFSISQIQDNFNELTSQLKSGLRLAPYENLYIKLTNSKGSTVAPPTTVQTLVLLTIGNLPSQARLKQLAQTITGSHSKNLGLNNTVFGRVKQVRLSSILQHSLGGDASPTPAPLPPPHHHHHHHHHHHNDVYRAPAISPAPVPASKIYAPATKKGSPAPAPAPLGVRSHNAEPPGCQFGYGRRFPRKAKKQSHVVPPVVPPIPPTYTAPSPRQQVNTPPPPSYQTPAASPLPKAVFAHVQPPTNSEFDAEPPDITSSISPSPTPSSSSASLLPTALWAVLQFLVLVLHQL